MLTGFAVAKFDEGCNLVWVREFGPEVATTMFASYASAVATDAQGNLTIAGTFEGTVDFGAGAVTAVSTAADGILLRLDPSGATVFARHFVNARTGATMGTFGLAETPAGVSTLALEANTDTDFGSGQEPSLLGPSADYEIVQFDGAGKVLFREPVASLNPSVATITQIATNASGFLWTYGTEPDPFGAASGVVPDPLLVGLTASGAYAWQQPPMVTVSAHPPIWIAAGPAGAVVFTRQDDAPAPTETLQGLAADGSSTWTTTTPVSSSAGGTSVIVDGRGSPVVLGVLTDSATIGSAPPLTSAGGEDVVYQVFDSTGHLVSVGSWGTPDDEIQQPGRRLFREHRHRHHVGRPHVARHGERVIHEVRALIVEGPGARRASPRSLRAGQRPAADDRARREHGAPPPSRRSARFTSAPTPRRRSIRTDVLHELGHALQDDVFGMNGMLAPLGQDERLAHKAVYEGDATVVAWGIAGQRSGRTAEAAIADHRTMALAQSATLGVAQELEAIPGWSGVRASRR